MFHYISEVTKCERFQDGKSVCESYQMRFLRGADAYLRPTEAGVYMETGTLHRGRFEFVPCLTESVY